MLKLLLDIVCKVLQNKSTEELIRFKINILLKLTFRCLSGKLRENLMI